MAKLYIPMGIPGCGKSTFAHTVLSASIVSSDAIRKELTGDENDQSRNQKVFEIYHERIERDLLDSVTERFDVFADATNLRDFARKRLRDIAERVSVPAHLIVFTNLSEAIRRNGERERRVKPEVMVSMLAQYEQAMKDIPNETYDSVTFIESVS